MTKSQNTRVDYTVPATSMRGLTKYGKVIIGDKAFEFYNDKNVHDYIQIPYTEIDHIDASVLFNKKITRFAIFVKNQTYFTFSTRDNIKTLRALRPYLGDEKLLRSLSVLDVLKRQFKK